MKHFEIRDLWLQKEVAEGKVKVYKTPGTQNPADLMTKILSWGDIVSRLGFMNLFVEGGSMGENVDVSDERGVSVLFGGFWLDSGGFWILGTSDWILIG